MRRTAGRGTSYDIRPMPSVARCAPPVLLSSVLPHSMSPKASLACADLLAERCKGQPDEIALWMAADRTFIRNLGSSIDVAAIEAHPSGFHI